MSSHEMTISCGGKLTIAESAEVHETFEAAFQKGVDLTIDCSFATEIDLTFIQLLISGRRTASERGVNLRISAPMDAPITETLRRAGFVPEEILSSSRD